MRGLEISDDQSAQLLGYLDLVMEWRRHVNLTGLHDAGRMFEVLLLESLDFFQHDLFESSMRILDLGTGAGIPGIPLAIMAPALDFTLLDRSEKKMIFVRRVVRQLALTNCSVHCDTSETLARRLAPLRYYERIVSRGVGSIVQLLRLAAPLLKPGGKLILRKPLGTPEMQEAAAILQKGDWEGTDLRHLPWSEPRAWCLLSFTKARG